METFVDKPKPGAGYVTLLVTAGLLVSVLQFWLGAPIGGWVVAVVFAVLLDAALRTRYLIDGKVLRVRCGFLIWGTYPLSDLRNVQPASFNQRTLGWSIGVRGYCNRFRNGLLVTTTKGLMFYISPSNPEAFAKRLAAHPEITLSVTGDISPVPEATQDVHKIILLALFAGVGALHCGLAVPLIQGVVAPNGSYGFRTPATLSDPAVWYQANQFGGYALFAAGMVTIVACVLLALSRRRLSFIKVTVLGLLVYLVPLAAAVGASVVYLRQIT